MQESDEPAAPVDIVDIIEVSPRVANAARRAVAAYHRKNPFLRGMTRRQLRIALEKAGVPADEGTLLAHLFEKGVLVPEGVREVRLPEHVVILPSGWPEAAQEIVTVYRAAGLTPPLPGNFQAHYPRSIHVDSILVYLADNGDLVRLADGLYLAAETVARVKELMRDLASGAVDGAITIASVRDATNSSRKIIVALLESLDREGFTKRAGDIRYLA